MGFPSPHLVRVWWSPSADTDPAPLFRSMAHFVSSAHPVFHLHLAVGHLTCFLAPEPCSVSVREDTGPSESRLWYPELLKAQAGPFSCVHCSLSFPPVGPRQALWTNLEQFLP